MRAAIATLAAAGVLIGTTAVAAQDDTDLAAASAERLVKAGSWRMTATQKGPDGKPECIEVWHFNADGTGRVESGEERIDNIWRTERKEGDTWLYTRSMASNGAPDCMGESRDPASLPGNPSGVLLVFFNNGDAILCQPTYSRGPDGTLTPTHMYSEENCWGRLAPLPKG
ncbi:hypothetical protein [Erythrobacter sp. CCH5-A1]|jgi:hypothetical protein|uniref:hypothetical protein n=1 Tax=Erythrobacter sp. CCH5-A1 TaxID=1768792 RepID=UPI00082AB660|nr:hypothetical protein [Erythrobacter sp. CCH5-A1]